jgi:ArsR family transcriptional regulator, arsenate/arsenite/antimonite-responsive transcriptional repressor
MSKYETSVCEELAEALKALSNSNRLSIYQQIIKCCPEKPSGPCRASFLNCIEKFSKELSIAPSTVSHHIKELRIAGLIKVERSGQHMLVYADTAKAQLLSEFFHNCCGNNQEPKGKPHD